MSGANTLDPVWDDLRALNASLQRTLDEFRKGFHKASAVGKDMPDARVRLDHVLKLTEEGAHRTLDLVEASCPIANRIATEAAALIPVVQQARGADGSSELLGRVETFLAGVKRDGEGVRANLDEVLMAQSYQDLSGQIIRTVIKLVVELERTLGNFAHLAGEAAAEEKPAVEAAISSQGFGPAVPGVTTDAVGEQEDVDALLARMGM